MTTGGEVEQDVAIGNDGTEAPVTVEPPLRRSPPLRRKQRRPPRQLRSRLRLLPRRKPPVVDDEDKADEATTKITSTTLTPGTTSEEVRILQERLMELNYMESDLPTGFYGSITKEAIQYFPACQ